MFYLKTHPYFAIFLTFSLTMMLSTQPSFAKMRAIQMISANEVTSHYKSEIKKNQLTIEETEQMNLATLAEEIFEVKEFTVEGYPSTKVEQIKAVYIHNIADAIRQAIQQKKNWKEALASSKMDALKKESKLLMKALGENSLGWSWYLYQIGKKNEAQLILSKEFERTYAETMKLTKISGFKGSTPSWEAESFHKVLIPLSSESDNKAREQKVQKMRLHISNLPNMQMMT